METITELAVELRPDGIPIKRDLFYRQLIEILPFPIFIHDGKFITWANDNTAELLGLEDLDKVIGNRIEEVFGPAFWQTLATNINEAMRDHRSSCFQQVELAPNDGEKVYLELTSLLYVFGYRQTVLSFMRDITAKVLAEKARKEYEQRFRLFMNNLPGLAFIKNLQGQYIYFNRSFIRLSGYDGTKLASMDAKQIWSEDVAEKLLEQEVQVLKKGGPIDAIVTRVHDGVTQYWHRSIFPIGDGWNFQYIGGVCVDITSQIEAEKNLLLKKREAEEYATELERSNIALDVILKHQRADFEKYSGKLVNNIKKLVIPYLEMMNQTGLQEDQARNVGMALANLNNIISPVANKMSHKLSKLSPRELEVALLVKDGKSTLEIADGLCISDSAVSVHRKNIRRKMGLKGRRVNLRVFLQGVEDSDFSR